MASIFGELLNVPTVPNCGEPVLTKSEVAELAADLFAHTVNLAARAGTDYPPQLDDLTARCVNRMGGWTWFVRVVSAGHRLDGELAEFMRLMLEFSVHKDSGFYMSDRLPVLVGSVSSERAYRLDWPPSR